MPFFAASPHGSCIPRLPLSKGSRKSRRETMRLTIPKTSLDKKPVQPVPAEVRADCRERAIPVAYHVSVISSRDGGAPRLVRASASSVAYGFRFAAAGCLAILWFGSRTNVASRASILPHLIRCMACFRSSCSCSTLLPFSTLCVNESMS